VTARSEATSCRWDTESGHHELALIEDPGGGAAGPLHRLGFKVGNSIEELIRVKEDPEHGGVGVLAALDLRVSQAIFVTDPDSTTIELYVDTPGEPWRTSHRTKSGSYGPPNRLPRRTVRS